MHTEVLPPVVFLSCIRNTSISLNLMFTDLSTKNLAFYNGHLSHLSREELLEVLGSPDAEELTRLDGGALGQGIPMQLVESTGWVGWPLNDDEDDENIRIIDLGEAFTQDTVPEKLAQPDCLQAPETIFTGKLDYRQDLWRVGLVVRLPLPTLETDRLKYGVRFIILSSEYCRIAGGELTPWLNR